MILTAEHHHQVHGVPIEPLSVFYGKEEAPEEWDLTPFPTGNQENETWLGEGIAAHEIGVFVRTSDLVPGLGPRCMESAKSMG